MSAIIFKEESYAIIGACLKVHTELGPGFLEAVYQEALEKEFLKRKIPYKRHQKLKIFYDGGALDKFYVADFICHNQIVMELKVASEFSTTQFKQLQNYLKATKLKLGILVNFGKPSLNYKRIINPAC
jgi:GxxExxY protein